MVYCKDCGAEIGESGVCDCSKVVEERVDKKKANKTPMEKFVRQIAIILGIWGLINFLWALLGGVILLIFAGALFVTESEKAVYIFAVLWLIYGFFQVISGWWNDALYLYGIAILNILFALYILYKLHEIQKTV